MENKKINIGIVAAEFNYDVTYAMVELAKEHAKFLNAEVVEIIKVPGAYDIPFGVKILLSKENIDCVVTLGAIIEGQTGHDEVIAQQSARKIIDLSLEFNKPVALGISGPGMSRIEAHERVDYAKRAVEAAVKMCRIKFASEGVKDVKIAEEKIEEPKEFIGKEITEEIKKRGRPKKAKSKLKIKGRKYKKEIRGQSKLKKIKDKEKGKIIEEIKKSGKITTGEVMKMFNVSKSTAWVAMNELLKEGLIIRKGRKGASHYVFANTKNENK